MVDPLSVLSTPSLRVPSTAGDAHDPALGRDELAVLLAINRAIGRHLERDQLFGAMATCLKTVVATDRFGIELPIEGDSLQGHLLTPRDGNEEPTQPTVLPAQGTACNWVLQHREWVIASCREELREPFPVTFEVMRSQSMESLCALPLVTGEKCRAVLFFMATAPGAYVHVRRALLEQIASSVAVALDNCLAHEEVRGLRDQLAAENQYLREEIREDHDFEEIVGNSPELRQVFTLINRVAPTTATVLILGETGTGKELVARAIHERSPRRQRPLVKVNCAAIPAGLIESELFGHVRGAFTGALAARSGRFELANHGTIFLDEIGELSRDAQVRLLRVLQEREFEPVGSSEARRVDVRVIAATNRDLAAAVEDGTFRQDLYYRLNVFPVHLPPLRARPEDIPVLAHYFVARYAAKIGRKISQISRASIDHLVAYRWPGNVRELEHVIERAVILSPWRELTVPAEVLPASPAVASEAPPAAARPEASHDAMPLEEVERGHIASVLKRTNWRIDGPDGAARLIGMNPSTLRSRMKKLGIQRSAGKHP
jgi:formate hydrogenlyase transcriptional activator